MASIFTHNKAQLSIQFNWIFVLIMGAVILAFFITIINSKQKQATAEEATDLVNTLDSVFTTIQTNPDTYEAFNISNVNIEFTCEPGLSQYYIQGTGPVSTKYDVIFTPETLKGDKIFTWTQTWKAPYETTTFTNMANDRTLFLFISNQPTTLVAQLYEEMPTIFKKVKMNQDELKDFSTKGYDRYVIITDITNLEVHKNIEEKAHIRYLQGTDTTYGEIVFKHQQTTDTLTYFTKEMLWGAIFTENKETYECTIKKALMRHSFIANVLQKRIESIEDAYTYSRCYDFYEDAKLTLTNIANYDDGIFQLSSLKNHVTNLRSTQGILERGPTCPHIY